MKGKITIQSAIDELQRMFRLLNTTYFNGELETPVITILTDSTSGAYGWITVNKVWSSKDQQWYREINMCAEYLNREPAKIVTTLQHEMCHLWNIQQGIQDCSRAGTYHNKHFKAAAESHGLEVQQDSKYGWCVTTPSPELAALVAEHCRAGCFKLERMKTYKNGKPKVTKPGEDGKERTTTRAKSSSKKYICPMCGLIVRATKEVSIIHADCDAEFRPASDF